MNINLHNAIGRYCMTYEEGQVIYDLIHPELSYGGSVIIDFENTIQATSFLNAAIGQLLRDISPYVLNELLTIDNLTQVNRIRLKHVVDCAKVYYGIIK